MLNRRESEVMQAVYSLCREDGRCLVAPADLLKLLPKKEKCTEEKLEKILKALELDDYFEMISSDRKGEKTVSRSSAPRCRCGAICSSKSHGRFFPPTSPSSSVSS